MPAAAAQETFNPFDINRGFTAVAQGDAYLNNGEVEGAVAAFGVIATGNPNGYPGVHSAAGEADYTVPSIDGTPVRILATAYIGDGALDVSNRDDSKTIAADSPEANAVVKLVSLEGMAGSKRSDFLRLTNNSNGIIDLKSVKFDDAAISNFKTEKPAVSDYFADVDQKIARTTQCLASMYNPELALSHAVDLNERGGMLYPSDFDTKRPNVINYADVAGKTIKMDNADGYKPTAEAPLVIRVAKGVTSLQAINIEGWSPNKGQEQKLARYIMLDMSEVTGEVKIDGLTLGSIWAPQASLNFSSGVTTNGQWFAGGNIKAAGGGELHHHTFLGQLPCGDRVADPTPDPKIGTTVAVDGSQVKVLPLTGGTVIDTVAYEGLTPGTKYELAGEVRTAPAGEKTGIVASAEFTPTTAAGTTTVEFVITADQVAAYAGQDLVVFEYLTADGQPVAEHTDPKDQAQTFTVAKQPLKVVDPKIGTTVAVDGSQVKVLPLTGGTVIDTVAYEGLTPGTKYELAGEVRTAPAGEKTGIVASAEFTPTTAAGTTTVEFVITADQVAAYAGQDLVVFEYLTADGQPVAEHTDPKDQAQTFTVAEQPVNPDNPKKPAPEVPKEELAKSGGEAAWPALSAGILLFVGGMMLLLKRRSGRV
ncbi:VaFE repeat-containing surface-anchored protein [Mycetocola spongiae]|uniref:VaFE repeat-containing surface-anchored protein n=1 Tax=Mycetocola spongiae TaxID=2859226 RepID=UPI001CF426E9|nr:VaFE repeat-containing surface-anchored protein [Mycetocola spongiae]UCR87851.1 VaFE repeat-containing surface-anchored protein [Mycetocola spongiae]